MAERLGACGFHVHPAYPVAGTTVDLLLEKGGRSFSIDLVGHPGTFAPPIARERRRMLARAGLRLFSLSLFAWRADEEASVKAILQFSASSIRR